MKDIILTQFPHLFLDFELELKEMVDTDTQHLQREFLLTVVEGIVCIF